MPGTMIGTVWHPVRIHPAEGDERRYKGRCRYYCDKYCQRRATRCGGSAHCEYYEEISQNDSTVLTVSKKPFADVKEIDMSDIIVPTHFSKPPKEKIHALRDYWVENDGQLDQPIIVSCQGDKYVLEDKYLRYYVAKELNQSKIYARCGKKGCDKEEKLFRKEGTRVKVFDKMGAITKVELEYVTVTFDDGETKRYRLITAVANKTLVFMK
ncbi:MAG: hypothetical protein IJY43_05060 [Clostridia bacterium]|nr:hypothetical protein [Clostridia bacterium]